MRNKIMVLSALALIASACQRADARPARKLFMDVHDLGAGKVTAKDVAEAHRKDLATEASYGVDYKAYWVSEQAGKVYCLAEAPSADAASAVHRKAHGLVASKVMEVTPDNTNWTPTPGMKLFMDVHHLGAGKVSAEDVAQAHKKDLAVEARHNVKYLNYWVDPASGTVMCLAEAASAADAVAVHTDAHGLLPDSIVQVSEGR
jgi:ATP-dependent Clp protease adapter protein ClpS